MRSTCSRQTANDDPPVKMYNYYDSKHDWKPVVAYDALSLYFIDALRGYLNLS